MISRNTRVQAQLISDLLDISRIVSGKLRLDIQQVDLATVVADAIDTVQQDADEKGVVIDRALETAVGPIAGDPARLQQIVWNLLSNAIKFTPGRRHDRGGTRVAPGADAEITVTDSGVGIRPDFLPHIFDRFQQADQSITRRFGGLGLGLSIVKHLVELHGGRISADSQGEGQGATFTIVFFRRAPEQRRRTFRPIGLRRARDRRCRGRSMAFASSSSRTSLTPASSSSAS